LARALHERGETDRARDLLDGYLESHPGDPGATIHRAWIHYDAREGEALARDVELLGGANLAAPSIRALAIAREGRWEEAIFPRAGLWTADVLGRLVALLEMLHAARVPSSDDPYHHRLFAPDDRSSKESTVAGGESRGGAATERDSEPEIVAGDRESWEKALEHAFLSRRYKRFLELWENRDVPPDWIEGLSREYWLFAHWAVSPPEVAARHAQELATAEPRNVEHHFLMGLALLRAQKPVEASHAFVRAARLDDIRIHEIAEELAREEGVVIRLVDD